MKIHRLLSAIALVLLGNGTSQAAPAPTHTPAPETLRAFVARLLVLAPTDFSSVRGTRKSGESYYARYSILPKLTACPRCKLTDQYSWTAHNENWSIENEWNGAKGASQAKIVSYVSSQLTPALTGYSLKKTGPTDDPTFVWSGAMNKWVFVHVYNGGLTVRVGHDLIKPVHVLLAPTVQQLAALRAGISTFVSSGTAAAPSNFASLRAAGSKDVVGAMEYPLLVPFGPLLEKCSITDATVNTFNVDDYSPKWTMNCSTPPMVGNKVILEEPLRAAMQAALPAGFTPTTDRALLFVNDYRWDSTDRQVAVDVDSFATYTLPNGLVQFSFGVIHFLPKQSTPSTPGKPRLR